jgi:hypothetical protein
MVVRTSLSVFAVARVTQVSADLSDPLSRAVDNDSLMWTAELKYKRKGKIV